MLEEGDVGGECRGQSSPGERHAVLRVARALRPEIGAPSVRGGETMIDFEIPQDAAMSGSSARMTCTRGIAQAPSRFTTRFRRK
jgi:hypothetical protein